MNASLMIILGLLIITIFVLAIFVFKANERVNRLLQGKGSKDLEDTLNYLTEEVKRMNQNQEIIEKTLNNLNGRLKKSITGFKTVRFNPFPDSGSNQSFAIALINEEGDGLIISSLYSREKMSIFAKPIKAGKSEFELTTEEKRALSEAK